MPNKQRIVLSTPLKLSWDKRAWFLGLLLGSIDGLLLLCGGNPTLRRFLESAFPYTAFGYYTGDFLTLFGAVAGGLIFPAVVTSVAKRLYFLWGLLPLCLLILWIVAGNIVAHTIYSALDPLWALPLAALVCWAVASFPVALIRFLIQRRGFGGSRTPLRSPTLKWERASVLIIPPLSLTILGAYNLGHPVHFEVEIKTHGLSEGPVRVPLVKKDNGLYVKAWLNDTEELCRLDTGASNVFWPRDMHVVGRLTSRREQSYDVLGGRVSTQTVVLPQIRIGGYEITGVPTEMTDDGSGLFSTPQQTGADEEPLLGNPAFVMTVLTVDYRNAVLTIRPPQYDFTHQPRKAEDRILQMGWTTSYPPQDWESSFCGVPAVRVLIAGSPLWCTLDTGAGEPALYLTDSFVKDHPSLRRARRDLILLNATYSSTQVERLHDLGITFPSAPPAHGAILLTLDAVITPTLDSDESDGSAIIGLALMKRYRITIDYQRRRILLEPYAQAAPSRKQEKTPPKPKQKII